MDIVDTINDIIVYKKDDKFIISSLLNILYDNIKIIYDNSNSSDNVEKYNDIVRMFKTFFFNWFFNFDLVNYI